MKTPPTNAHVLVGSAPGAIDAALKLLKKLPEQGGIRRSLLRHKFAMSPGQRRRDKHVRAVRATRRRAAKAAATAERSRIGSGRGLSRSVATGASSAGQLGSPAVSLLVSVAATELYNQLDSTVPRETAGGET